MEEYNIDQMIETILKGKKVPEGNLLFLMDRLKDILYQESTLLKLQAPIIICGDIHGQLFDLKSLFMEAGRDQQDPTFLFMGDYVDRGVYSTETFALLAAKKVKNPNKIYLLRGNHECRQTTLLYGFYEETMKLYRNPRIFNAYHEVFDLLPLAARIQDHFFAVHGGLSKSIQLTEQIEIMNRGIDIPASGPMADLCWSDPDPTVTQWKQNQRGAGFIFGEPQCSRFLHLNGLQTITRSHQVAPKGYDEVFPKKLITVWSAPCYTARNDIQATFMKVDADCNYKLIKFLHQGNSYSRNLPSDSAYFT